MQFKSFGYHFAFGFIGAMVFLLAAHIRGRGGWLANVAVALAFLGITTLPGFILADFYDSAIGQVAGLDANDGINRKMEDMWALSALAATGGAGLILSVPLIAAATWRAALVPSFAAALPVAGILAFAVAANEIGAVVSALFFAAFSVMLWRTDWSHSPRVKGSRCTRPDIASSANFCCSPFWAI